MVPLLSVESCTIPAGHVMVLAEDEARISKSNAVGTEHILLGMLRDDQGLAATALASIGVTIEAVRQLLGEITRVNEGGPSSYGISGRLTFTKASLNLLWRSRHELSYTSVSDQEQKNFPRNQIGTGEILLGIITGQVGVAAQVFAELGVDFSMAHEQVAELVRRSEPEELRAAHNADLCLDN